MVAGRNNSRRRRRGIIGNILLSGISRLRYLPGSGRILAVVLILALLSVSYTFYYWRPGVGLFNQVFEKKEAVKMEGYVMLKNSSTRKTFFVKRKTPTVDSR